MTITFPKEISSSNKCGFIVKHAEIYDPSSLYDNNLRNRLASIRDNYNSCKLHISELKYTISKYMYGFISIKSRDLEQIILSSVKNIGTEYYKVMDKIIKTFADLLDIKPKGLTATTNMLLDNNKPLLKKNNTIFKTITKYIIDDGNKDNKSHLSINLLNMRNNETHESPNCTITINKQKNIQYNSISISIKIINNQYENLIYEDNIMEFCRSIDEILDNNYTYFINVLTDKKLCLSEYFYTIAYRNDHSNVCYPLILKYSIDLNDLEYNEKTIFKLCSLYDVIDKVDLDPETVNLSKIIINTHTWDNYKYIVYKTDSFNLVVFDFDYMKQFCLSDIIINYNVTKLDNHNQNEPNYLKYIFRNFSLNQKLLDTKSIVLHKISTKDFENLTSMIRSTFYFDNPHKSK